MGITIHYSGRFNPKASLQEMIVEVKEIAENFNWKYRILNTEFPAEITDDNAHNGEIYGIQITPPEFETVDICFLSNLRMSGRANILIWDDATDPDERKFLYQLHSKSQFAGPELHKMVIELFRHLNKRNYFSEFHLFDESSYWETGDEVLMQQKFKFLETLIDEFPLASQTIPRNPNESFEDYFERLLKRIQNKKNLGE